MTLRDWVPIVGVAVSLAGLAVVLSRGRAATLDQIRASVIALEKDMDRRLDALIRDVTARGAALETKVEVFWRHVALPAAQVLHSPDPAHARRDALLEALMARRLDLDGAVELAGLVEEVFDDPDTTDAERIAAGQVLGYLQVMFGAGADA